MNTKVYLLMGGWRDDRHVLGAFSTREAAEAALRFGDDDTAVEEYRMDAPLPDAPAGHSLWRVQWEEQLDDLSSFRVEAFDPGPIGEVGEDLGMYHVLLWAKDKEHALGIGSELIDRYKALKGAG